jgi:hypothetical protein
MDMNEQFIKDYTAALNRATAAMQAVQEKRILIDGDDDGLVREMNEAQAEVKKFNDILLSLNQK